MGHLGKQSEEGIAGGSFPAPLPHSQEFSKSDLFSLQQLCTRAMAGPSPPWLRNPGSSQSLSPAESRAWAVAGSSWSTADVGPEQASSQFLAAPGVL